MSDDNEFAARLDAVERDVAAARSDAAAARTDAAAARELASGAYEDLSRVQLALNAHFRVLNALRETQLDHGRRLDSLEGRFDRLEGRFDGLEGRFDGLEGRFDGLEGRFDRLESEMREGFSVLNLGMAQITAMLTTLIGDAGQNGPASPN
jgi:chromosome segregation ATPase